MKTARKQDAASEDAIMSWLVGILQRWLWGSRVSRIVDKTMQLLGVDLKVTWAKQTPWNIDAKVQAGKGWVGTPASTQCLEISSLNKHGERVVGWFTNDRLATTHYLVGLIHEVNEIADPAGYITDPAKEIKRMELILIQKQALKDYLESIMSMDEFDKIEAELLETGDRKRIINNDVKVVYSSQLGEEPVNICVNLDVYRQLADNIFMIENGKLKVMPKPELAA